MVRIDMSEYMEKHAVSRLVGAPPGYVGYEDGGQLTEAVRRKPYAVVLLDEVEKAHPDVFNILLQVLDDGRLTDSRGRTVNFRNTILIMTSNLGSQALLEGITKHGEIQEGARREVMESLKTAFRPEFLNRLDETVLFKPLTRDEVVSVARILLSELEERLRERGLGLVVSDNAVSLIAQGGYDPVFGARPLKRYIQRELETPIARRIVAGDFAEGDTVHVDADMDSASGFAITNKKPNALHTP